MSKHMVSLLTADELLQRTDDGCRCELVAGELVRMSPAGGEHGFLCSQVDWTVTSHVKANRLGLVFGSETGFLLQRDPDTVLAPDLAFVASARLDRAALPRGYPELAPDFVVEVRSPRQSLAELQHKMRAWLQAGCRLGWLVDPDGRRAFVHTPEGVRIVAVAGRLDGGDVLPGLALPLADLFAR